jgi:hypothetical protein
MITSEFTAVLFVVPRFILNSFLVIHALRVYGVHGLSTPLSIAFIRHVHHRTRLNLVILIIMKNNIFTQVKKKGIGYTILGLFMVLSLVLQNASYVQYAYAHESEEAVVSDVSSESDTAPIVEEQHSVVLSETSDEDKDHEDGDRGDDDSERRNRDDHDEDKNDEHDSDHIGTIKDMFHDLNTAKPSVKIVAANVVCDDESKLPNWGLGGPDITSHTAADYVAAHPGCTLTSDWKFQWGFSGVKDLSGNFIGEADGSKGPGTDTGAGISDWKTFGPTDGSGVAMTTICDLSGSPRIWVREILKDGYSPFTYDPAHPQNDNNVSAELYCHGDVLNYDNYDYINAPALGTTYYCVGFNAVKPVPYVNQAPAITVVGVNPATVTLGGTYVDLSATVFDAEDGVITNKLVTTGTVNTSLLGAYVITYNATDSQNLAATPKTRTVNVVPANGCTADCPINHAPVITLVGENPLTVLQNTVFTDPGATAFDLEDGTITPSATGTVNTSTLGAYSIIYTASDSQGATATPVTRVVNVVPEGGCTSNCGGTTNTAPVVTLLGLDPMTVIQNTVFTDPGATAFDLEDGTITPLATGTVNTSLLGAYVITYNATDSQNLAATPKTRTVNVVPVGTPINQKPEITLLGDVVMQLVVGTSFTDPSATVSDPEDGNITNKLVASGTVDVNTIGAYTITYNATDSQNLAADQKTRTVNIVALPSVCTANCGGGSSTFDYYGCTDRNASNYNSLANRNDGSCTYPGGGGGGGSVPLTISNEKLTVTGTTSVTVTWNTNLPSDSRVVYGDASVTTLGGKPSYGYPLTTATDTVNAYNHSMVINGVPSAIATYYRPVSATASESATGIQLTRTPDVGGNTAASCEYLKEYLRLGANNNPSEVTKLQLFLKNYDNAENLEVTGFFDLSTDRAVRSFQDKYKKDVLDTWNLPSNTGYVYYTTKKKINEIYCQREFPLTPEQVSEIASFRALIERVNSASGTGEVLPLVGTNTTGASAGGSVAGAATVKPAPTPVTVTVTPSNEKTETGNGYAGLDAQAGKAAKDGNVTPENRGRIAIADLLATAPSIAEDVTSSSDVALEDENATATAGGVVAGENTGRSLLASVVNSLSDRFSHSSPTTVYLTLIFLILALVFVTLYFRKTNPVPASNEAPSPVDTDEEKE